MGMILLTGGAGYIGLHSAAALIAAGHDVVLFDNFSNSKPQGVARLEAIVGRRVTCITGDVREKLDLARVFADYPIAAVVHFAGLKAVGEGQAEPLRYYDNNVVGSLRLVEAMAAAGVKRLVFSSSATVYGEPDTSPIPESAPLRPANVYGRTKRMVEEMLGDLQRADPAWSVASLRYFNPVGAHPSGLIGEDPNGMPNNLMPFVAQVAVGRLPELKIFGGDYPTPDGTGVRDYIHVVDLARGHLAALNTLRERSGLLTINLGTGRGYSVLEMVQAFAAASGKAVPFRIVGRRPGDIAQCYADPVFARDTLGWRAQLGIDAMCADTWRWQQWAADNPS